MHIFEVFNPRKINNVFLSLQIVMKEKIMAKEGNYYQLPHMANGQRMQGHYQHVSIYQMKLFKMGITQCIFKHNIFKMEIQ